MLPRNFIGSKYFGITVWLVFQFILLHIGNFGPEIMINSATIPDKNMVRQIWSVDVFIITRTGIIGFFRNLLFIASCSLNCSSQNDAPIYILSLIFHRVKGIE